jgi:hypothetical protein
MSTHNPWVPCLEEQCEVTQVQPYSSKVLVPHKAPAPTAAVTGCCRKERGRTTNSATFTSAMRLSADTSLWPARFASFTWSAVNQKWHTKLQCLTVVFLCFKTFIAVSQYPNRIQNHCYKPGLQQCYSDFCGTFYCSWALAIGHWVQVQQLISSSSSGPLGLTVAQLHSLATLD